MKNNNKLTFEQLQRMFPQATVRTFRNGSVKQLHWQDGKRENSITFFPKSQVSEMKRASFGMNDVQWIGNFRFSSTF
mgnify:CR=1